MRKAKPSVTGAIAPLTWTTAKKAIKAIPRTVRIPVRSKPSRCLTGNSLEMLPTTVSAALTKTTGKRTASISVAIPVTVAYRSG